MYHGGVAGASRGKSERRLTMWTGSHGYRPEYVEVLRQAYSRGGPLERAFYLSPEVLNADIDRVWRRIGSMRVTTARSPGRATG